MKKPSKAGWRGRFTAWAIAGTGLVALGGGVWGVTAFLKPANSDSKLPVSLSAEVLATSDDPGAVRNAVRDVLRRDDLTDEQRRDVLHEMREARRAQMQQRVDAYFAAAEADKNAVLDAHIDEWQERWEAWQVARAEGSEEDRPDRETMRRLFGTRSKQERKERSESRSADDMARTFTYFSAMRTRMNERGIRMPAGPNGGGGPRGISGGPGSRRVP